MTGAPVAVPLPATSDGALLPLGQGQDSFAMRRRGFALTVADDTVRRDTSGQRIRYQVEKVDSMSELKATLDIGASASFSGLLGSGSAKARFVGSQEVSAFHVHLVVRCTVDSGRTGLGRFALGQEARDLLAGEPVDLPGFHRRYGDEFVSAVTTGGELVVLYEFRTTSATHRRQVSAALEGAIGGVKGQGDLAETFQRIQSTTRVHLELFVDGGHGTLPRLDAQEILEFSRTFPERLREGAGAVILREETTDYQAAEGFPAHLDLPYADNRLLLDELAHLYDAITTHQAALAYMRRHPDQFEVPAGSPGVLAHLTTPEAMLARLRTEVEAAARGLARAPYDDATATRQMLGGWRDALAEVRRSLPEELEDTMPTIQSGVVNAYHKDDAGWSLNRGDGPREYRRPVTFDQPFLVTPSVHVAVQSSDVHAPPSGDQGGHHRFGVEAAEVSPTGFTLLLKTWGTSQVDAAKVAWLAHLD